MSTPRSNQKPTSASESDADTEDEVAPLLSSPDDLEALELELQTPADLPVSGARHAPHSQEGV